MKKAKEKIREKARDKAILVLISTASLLTTGAVLAEVTDATEVGKTTRQAMELQRSGRQSVETRPMLKDAADRSYERYLESFTHPIPELYERDESFVTN